MAVAFLARLDEIQNGIANAGSAHDEEGTRRIRNWRTCCHLNVRRRQLPGKKAATKEEVQGASSNIYLLYVLCDASRDLSTTMTMVIILAQMNDPCMRTLRGVVDRRIAVHYQRHSPHPPPPPSPRAFCTHAQTTQIRLRPLLPSSLDRVGVIGGGCGSVEQNASEEGGGLARPSWADYQCDPAHDLVAAVALKCCLDKCVAYLVVLATQHSPSMHMRALMVASPRVAPNVIIQSSINPPLPIRSGSGHWLTSPRVMGVKENAWRDTMFPSASHRPPSSLQLLGAIHHQHNAWAANYPSRSGLLYPWSHKNIYAPHSLRSMTSVVEEDATLRHGEGVSFSTPAQIYGLSTPSPTILHSLELLPAVTRLIRESVVWDTWIEQYTISQTTGFSQNFSTISGCALSH
ncbi:hypothetical protein DL93DRAFT_2100625 [Clavulina sp. PMI_390]|nr:hypothetical protein DL93DRAFT_2100625 [Clavulina sp. PMI_390]